MPPAAHPSPKPAPARRRTWARRLLGLGVWVWVLGFGLVAGATTPAAWTETATRLGIAPTAWSAWVADAGTGEVLGAHRTDAPMHPASLMKLVTTAAALDQLGPGFVWETPVYWLGPDGHKPARPDAKGRLVGAVGWRGVGDPSLNAERLAQTMRQLRQLGLQRLEGDWLLDQSAFGVPQPDPAAFDGEPLRPYNAAPQALLVNQRVVGLRLVPGAQTTRLHLEPPLHGLEWPAQIPQRSGACGDWRQALALDWSDPLRLVVGGGYPRSCGERIWYVAVPDPSQQAGRALAGLWLAAGGEWVGGRWRDAEWPAGLVPVWVDRSPPLAEVVRDINKFSNNVMAQQLLLSTDLHAAPRPSRTDWPQARARLLRWWSAHMGGEAPVVDNGSGLSRDERIRADALGRLLRYAWSAPWRTALVESLPVRGVDGTLRRAPADGPRAALKTGSLRDVAALAGVVWTAGQQPRLLVVMVNHPDPRVLAASRELFDHLIGWAATP